MTPRLGNIAVIARFTALALFLLAGCGGKSPGEEENGALPDGADPGSDTSTDSPDGGEDTSSVSPADTDAPYLCADLIPGADLIVDDNYNYRLERTLTIEHTVLKDATNILFDWGGLTEDLYGEPLSPLVDIDLALLTLWHFDREELAFRINEDNLPISSYLKVMFTAFPEDSFTKQHLLDFTTFGVAPGEDRIWSYFDMSHPDFAYPQETHTFMLSLSKGTQPGKNDRMLALFTLSPASTNTELRLTNNATVLDYTVDLRTPKRLPIPVGRADLVFDWTALRKNAMGREFDDTYITHLTVAHYASWTLADMEAQFLTMNDKADQTWKGEIVQGTAMSLSETVDATRQPFPGIDRTGIWVIALFCDVSCNNPAPWFLTILQPCE